MSLKLLVDPTIPPDAWRLEPADTKYVICHKCYNEYLEGKRLPDRHAQCFQTLSMVEAIKAYKNGY